MGRIKEVYMEIQNKFGEDVEVTEQMFADFVDEREREREQQEKENK
jgi:hypothetical protein